jgi:hypothetical protein
LYFNLKFNHMKKITLFLILLITTYATNAQVVFSENWDGIGPGISGWTLYDEDGFTVNTNVSFINDAWVSTTEEFDNNVAMSTSWYSTANTSNDWLVSPSISIPAGTSTLYWDGKAYDTTYPDSYNVLISTTGNAPANFTTTLLAVEPEATDWTRHSIDLSAYAGQTIYIAFQNFSSDMFLLSVDNISILNNSTCTPPDRFVAYSADSTTSATIEWTGTSNSYDVAIGSPGFIPSTPTASTPDVTYTFSGLTANTRYHYYVRSSCGSDWIGPYSLFTANILPYAQGFETPAASGSFYGEGWVTGGWSLGNVAANAQAGTQYVFRNSSTTAATNSWLFTRPVSLSSGEQVTMTFYTRLGVATGSAHTLKIYVNDAVSTTGVTQLGSTLSITGNTYTLQTVTYTAPSSGVYYFAFNDVTPIITAATSLRLDTVSITSVLGTNSYTDLNFSLTPNPTKDIVNVSNTSASINSIEVTDLNGRVVKTVNAIDASNTQVNISDLSSGVYMMKIVSDQGTTTKKVIKE